ncbi:hypothetical protein HYH03_017162 [Edaphochlamys debaryana]|uniref:Uncharacterized protein n=1 Tax=Edaphochlamys debaryana TaxID=47281 RepID=A0A835XN50_9CHLO|nr:hypothetical protein HYH03_017162 [Edaphochlamys debaryana]|eukprot:KAG2483995.1 hypothetical protein HYH03_017162 [Edaphochlamys debaryana]
MDNMGSSASSSGIESEPPVLPMPWSSGISGAWQGPDVPQLCATPKRKLSVYRRGNRRVWYWLKRKPEFAKCSFCGALAGRNVMFSGAAGNKLCTGQCAQGPGPKATYPAEYEPPC